MSIASEMVEWARTNKDFATGHGEDLVMFVMPDDAYRPLLNLSLGGLLTEDEFCIKKKKSYLCGVRVMWTPKLPTGQAWFMYMAKRPKKGTDEDSVLPKEGNSNDAPAESFEPAAG